MNKKRKHPMTRIRSAALLLALAASLSQAQEITGTLTVLPNVAITVTNKDSNQSLSSHSDNAGVWYTRGLKPGRYTVKLEAKGFQTTTVAEVAVSVGAVEQSVTVTEAPPAFDFTGTTVAQNLTAAEIDRVPKGRSFQSVILLAPFTNSGNVEGGFQVNGASGAENNFMVDGLSDTSLVNGKSRQNAAFEYIQEVQVKTNGIEAEYGGALGGSLGGYILKNRLYFFSAFSPQFQRSASDYLFNNGAESGTINRKRLYMNAFNNLSFDPTSRIRTNLSWLYSPFYSEGTLPGYDGKANTTVSDRASNQSNKTRGFSNPQAASSSDINIQLSNTSLLSLRGGYYFDNFRSNGVQFGQADIFNPGFAGRFLLKYIF
jgi:hypothetical protein